MSIGKKLGCPNCHAVIRVAQPGAVTCPECGHQFKVRGGGPRRASDAPEKDAAEAVGHATGTRRRRQAQPDAVTESAGDAEVQSGSEFEELETDAESTRSGISRRPVVMLAIGLSGFLVAGVAMFAMLSGTTETPEAPGVPVVAGQNQEETGPEKQEVPASPSDQVAIAARSRSRDIPLFDSDVGASENGGHSGRGGSFDSNAVTNLTGTSAQPTSYWSAPAWSVVLQQGDAPLLNGYSVLTEVVTPTTAQFPLVLPPGDHVWQSGAGDAPQSQSVTGSFASMYLESKAELSIGGRLDFERLAGKTRPVGGAFDEPLLPHFWGNYFWQEEQPEAAVRFWKHAARIEPSFAPAHLNLAFAALEQLETDTALRELALAIHCNPLDAYGIEAHINALREQLGRLEVYDTSPHWSPGHYQAIATQLTGTPRDVTRALRTVSQYATDWRDRVRALNNAGVYLTARSLPAHAMEPLQRAVRIVVDQQALEQEQALVSTVFANLERAAQSAGLPEHSIYGWLKTSYQGQ